MKKLFSMLALAMLAVCANGADFNGNTLAAFYKSGDYAGLESAAVEMKSGVKNAYEKGELLGWLCISRQKQGKYASDDAAIADIDAMASEFGLPASNDKIQGNKLCVLYSRKSYQKAVDISANWTGSWTLYRRANCLAMLKRYSEAASVFAASGFKGGYIAAAGCAKQANLPVKVYEYALAAFNNGELTDPAQGITLVNTVLDADYSGTEITSAKVKELLQAVNRKYSRKLVPNAPSKWDELIQLVRQTLETY